MATYKLTLLILQFLQFYGKCKHRNVFSGREQGIRSKTACNSDKCSYLQTYGISELIYSPHKKPEWNSMPATKYNILQHCVELQTGLSQRLTRTSKHLQSLVQPHSMGALLNLYIDRYTYTSCMNNNTRNVHCALCKIYIHMCHVVNDDKAAQK